MSKPTQFSSISEFLSLSLFKKKNMSINFREREKENIDVKEKHQLVASHTRLNWELNPRPRYMHF